MRDRWHGFSICSRTLFESSTSYAGYANEVFAPGCSHTARRRRPQQAARPGPSVVGGSSNSAKRRARQVKRADRADKGEHADTLDDQESPRSRPLQTLEVDAKCGLWFFVSADSAKVGEIDAHQQHVSLSYADAHKQDYLSIYGSARLARDRAHMQLLWTPVGEGLVSARSG
ncbi:MAG: pyridoxamine 5'-phosphate oxidase family protein [Gammaproteobacteria bacterium]|nr:pyridoxamine 5'-phosphate oxidase family protein [Gammaproteobacteria bacterium]